MERAEGGYTIVEVLIVVAISMLLLGSAIIVVRGQITKTNFTQAMYDLNSKILRTSTEVTAGNAPDLPTSYYCLVDGATGYPYLTSSGGSPDQGDCIFLGKAFLFTPGQSTINIYTVYGDRNQHNGGTDTGVSVTNLSDASPEPAADSSRKLFAPENYVLPSGLHVVSATNQGTATNSLLLGIYASLDNANTTAGSGGATVLARTYPIDDSTHIRQCIEESPPCDSGRYDLGKWKVCIQDSGNSFASITVINAASGLTTNVNLDGC
jgi:type II secretory pathway pseudopilin PulG